MELDRATRLITTTPEICGPGPWTRERIASNISLAETYGRPIGMETARAIAFALVQDDWEAAHGAAGNPDGEIHPCDGTAPVLHFALGGALPDLDDLWMGLAKLGARTPDALAFATYIGALEVFLEAGPDGFQVWLNRPGHTGRWVDLACSEEELETTLGRGPVGKVLGSSGFGQLDARDVVRHEASTRRHRGEEVDPDDTTLADIRAWHRLTTAIRQHGPAYAAWVHAEEGEVMEVAPFDRRHVGPVDGIEAFCFSIGVRDGWWLPALSLEADHDLRAILSVDLLAMWRIYEIIGWAITPGVLGEDTSHLFAPVGHVGPPPSVAQVRATRTY